MLAFGFVSVSRASDLRCFTGCAGAGEPSPDTGARSSCAAGTSWKLSERGCLGPIASVTTTARGACFQGPLGTRSPKLTHILEAPPPRPQSVPSLQAREKCLGQESDPGPFPPQ